jgi:hypothetical protein
VAEIGDVVRLSVTNRDSDGNPADATTVTVTVRQPDGTTVAPPLDVEHAGTGSYYADLPVVQAGRHLVRWVGTDGVPFAQADVVDVWPTDPRYLFTLEQARGFVGDLDDDIDDLVRLYMAAVTPVIEDITGPLISEQGSRTFNGGVTAVLLPGPVSDVTVTENGGVLGAGQFTVDYDAGIVYAGDQLAPREFFPGRQNVTVTFTVGSEQIPPNIVLAALTEFRFLWQLDQQGNRFDEPDEDTMAWTPSGFAVPRRVTELCAAHPRPAGFA